MGLIVSLGAGGRGAIEGFSDMVWFIVFKYCGLLSGEEIVVGGQEWQPMSCSEAVAVVRAEIRRLRLGYYSSNLCREVDALGIWFRGRVEEIYSQITCEGIGETEALRVMT